MLCFDFICLPFFYFFFFSLNIQLCEYCCFYLILFFGPLFPTLGFSQLPTIAHWTLSPSLCVCLLSIYNFYYFVSFIFSHFFNCISSLLFSYGKNYCGFLTHNFFTLDLFVYRTNILTWIHWKRWSRFCFSNLSHFCWNYFICLNVKIDLQFYLCKCNFVRCLFFVGIWQCCQNDEHRAMDDLIRNAMRREKRRSHIKVGAVKDKCNSWQGILTTINHI